MPILILPAEVASQIAAGEVIERPASVVKELLENSLDAGAQAIQIEIRDAGRTLIEVGDDGSGIPAEELPLAVERHATSKLTGASDLFKIASLGFRGEALASIGSVARLTIQSRTHAAELGALLRVEGGQVTGLQPHGMPPGTIVRVENLFYNVPARLKFLKTDPTERRSIDKLAVRYALAYPQARFRLQEDGRPSLQTSGSGSRREVLGLLYGPDTARQMLEVIYQDEDVAVQGFISPSGITRPHRREMVFFVNGRPVQDAALATALLKGYHTLLMVGRYPLAAIFLEIPPEEVDVNVHPTKAEVRFRQPERIFTSLQSAVRRALLAHSPVQSLQTGLAWNGTPVWDSLPQRKDLPWEAGFDQESEPGGTPPGGQDQAPNERQPSAGQRQISAGGVPLLRPVGQIAGAYLVAEGPDGLYLIDQHAAHERVLFERFQAQAQGAVPSQTLLEPVTVQLSPAGARLLEEQLDLVNRIGFEVEGFGPDTFRVRAVPAVLAGGSPAAMLGALVDEFEEDETPLQHQREMRLIARICKRSAVKAGAALSPEEQRALLRDLEACESPRTCPHGRPTMIHLSVDLLERQFGRRGAR